MDPPGTADARYDERGSGEVELRELRYFVALAEELHFGRAAGRLGISQPPLSHAIRELERRVGASLVVRTSRTIGLTPAGEVLRDEGRLALAAAAAAVRRARRAGQPDARLVLTLKPGGSGTLLTEILRVYREEPGALEVDLAFSVGERSAMLRDGRADVGFLHVPQNDTSGLDTQELRHERQVVVLPEGHPLAGCASVSLRDLEDETVPHWPGSRMRYGRQGLGERLVVQDTSQLLQLVALGRAVAVVPESIRGRLPGGIVCRPAIDAPSATLVVAWSERSTSHSVAAFVRVAAQVAGAFGHGSLS
jgi:DNA-binding transcriptional LysR family regulator